MKWYQNPKILCFAGGVAAALVGAKVAKSPKTRELCVAGMAKGMKLQQDARVTPVSYTHLDVYKRQG